MAQNGFGSGAATAGLGFADDETVETAVGGDTHGDEPRLSTRFVLLCSRATTNDCGTFGVAVIVSARPRRESGVPISGLFASGAVVAGSVPAGVTGGAAA